MRLFNIQFKELLEQYKHDANCKSALMFMEADTPAVPTTKWTPAYVRKFLSGLRFEVKKRNEYFGHLLDRVSIEVVDPNSEQFKTMAVDGDHNLYINPEFVSRMVSGLEESFSVAEVQEANKDDPELQSFNALTPGTKVFLSIIAHELMHIFKDHVARGARRRKTVKINGEKISLFNIAADLEINDELLYKWGYHMTKNGVYPEPDGTFLWNNTKVKTRGKSPERIYAELLALCPPSEDGDDGDDLDLDKPIAPGDIIYNKKTKTYGEVVTVDGYGSCKIAEMTAAEAKAKLKKQ